MSGKSFLIAGALTLASIGVASAKSYEINLVSPAKAGSNQLKAGQYKLKVEGSEATFTSEQDATSVTVTVKIEHGGTKFSQTSVETESKGGVDTIQRIMLGGSDTKVQLGE